MANKFDPILGEYRQDDFTSLAFTELSDVPSTFSGQGTKIVRVNAAATALEFVTAESIENVEWGELGGTLSNQTDLQTALDAKGIIVNPLSQFAATTSLQLLGVISDETGSGSLVFATSPTLVAPVLGAATGTSLQLSGLTASEILITDASKNLVSLAVATYPSLTELTYLKGVTSAIQTQIGTKAATATTITIAGTANQITSSAGAQDLSANRTWTLSLPTDVLIPTVLTVPNTGLHLLDTNASHDLILKPGSDLTADRIFTLPTGGAARTLTLNGNPKLADW